MSRSTRFLAGAAVVLALSCIALGVAAPVVAGDPCYHQFQLSATTVESGTEVRTEPCAFEPAILVVPTGTTVTFRNESVFDHLVTGANQEWGDRDVMLAPATDVAYTFAEPGIYPYSCALHRGMTGAIVVGDGGPALASTVESSSGATGAGTADAADPATSSGAGAPATVPTFAVLSVAGLAAIVITLALVLRRRRVVAAASEPLGR